MELTTKELLTNYGIKTDHILVNLGNENGWSEKTQELYHQLNKRADKNSHKTNGTMSYRTESFTVTEDGSVYKVMYNVHSGD